MCSNHLQQNRKLKFRLVDYPVWYKPEIPRSQSIYRSNHFLCSWGHWNSVRLLSSYDEYQIWFQCNKHKVDGSWELAGIGNEFEKIKREEGGRTTTLSVRACLHSMFYESYESNPLWSILFALMNHREERNGILLMYRSIFWKFDPDGVRGYDQYVSSNVPLIEWPRCDWCYFRILPFIS